MKFKFCLILLIITFISCQKSPDNSVNVIIPLPPTALKAITKSSSVIELSWSDNSTNEDGFKIERKTVGGNFTLVGTTISDVSNYKDSLLNPLTTYTYRVYSYNSAGNSITYTNLDSAKTMDIAPQMGSTTPAFNITNISAQSGGFTSGNAITARGVCWGTAPNPTILNDKTTESLGVGNYNSTINGLIAGTTYYVRSYSSNSIGISYGNQVSFTTTTLPYTIIGTQVWTNQNLKVSTYQNGDSIPQVTDPTIWNGLTTGAWCWFNNDSVKYSNYGKLYNWYAVNDPRGLAPKGWHIPSDLEVQTLVNFVKGLSYPLIENGYTHWTPVTSGSTGTIDYNSQGNNSTGFTAIESFRRKCPCNFTFGLSDAWWWTYTKSGNINLPSLWWVTNSFNQIFTLWNKNWSAGFCPGGSDSDPHNGFNVRCLKD